MYINIIINIIMLMSMTSKTIIQVAVVACTITTYVYALQNLIGWETAHIKVTIFV